jgi:hypothetical protein
MSDFTLRPGQGQLFKNNYKTQDKHPNLKGQAVVEIDGKLHTLDLAAWTRQTRTGDKFLSLSVKLAQQQNGNSEQKQKFNDYVNQHGTPLDGDLDHAFGAGDRDDDIRF